MLPLPLQCLTKCNSEYQVVFYRGLADCADSSVLVALAGKATRILEDLLASGSLYRAPFHV